MKITEIRKISEHVWSVTTEYNWFERLFNGRIITKIELYKDSGRVYMCGGGTKYIDSLGNFTTNGSKIGEAIDKFRIMQNF